MLNWTHKHHFTKSVLDLLWNTWLLMATPLLLLLGQCTECSGARVKHILPQQRAVRLAVQVSSMTIPNGGQYHWQEMKPTSCLKVKIYSYIPNPRLMLTESMAAPGKLSNTVLFIKSETLVLLLFRKVTDSCVGGGKGLLVRSHMCVCVHARVT